MRSQCTKTREQPLFTATREKPGQQQGHSTTKYKIIFKNNKKKYRMGNGEPKPGSLQNHTDPNTEQWHGFSQVLDAT